jgi:hypothetical protein
VVQKDGTRLMSGEPSLPERIRTLRAEADDFIDHKAKQLAETTPGIPMQVLRNLLANRAYGCQCLAVLNNLGEKAGRRIG